MLNPASLVACVALVVLALAPPLQADDSPTPAENYELRYKFKPGETIRYRVEHRAKVRTTISGTTQTAETESFSEKVWRVKSVDEQGAASFEHSVDVVQMRQKVSGRQEETYDSTKDTTPSAPFQDVAKNVGVPLSVIKMDPKGRVLHRENLRPQPTDGQVTIPLPDEAVRVGHTWNVPLEVELRQESGAIKRVKTRQQYRLEEVNNGIARISMETVILTPVRDPALEAQLIQRETSGTVRFDIEAGRVISQEVNLDKQVTGFRGETSLMHYETRFTESLLPASQTAGKPSARPAGPALKR
jgi:hypothetical protein